MRSARFAGLLSFVAGVLMLVCGAFAWGITSTQLASENITVAIGGPARLLEPGLRAAGIEAEITG